MESVELVEVVVVAVLLVELELVVEALELVVFEVVDEVLLSELVELVLIDSFWPGKM